MNNFLITGSIKYNKSATEVLSYWWFESEEELKEFVKENNERLIVFEAIEILNSKQIKL